MCPLVACHVFEQSHLSFKWEGGPLPGEYFGHSAEALGNYSLNDMGLLKIPSRLIKDNGNLFRKTVFHTEHSILPFMILFEISNDGRQKCLSLGICIKIEVI